MLDKVDINDKEANLVFEKFSQLKTERQKYIPRWKDIQNYVAITNEINSEFEDNENKSKQKDVAKNKNKTRCKKEIEIILQLKKIYNKQ